MAHLERPVAFVALSLGLGLLPFVGWTQSLEERLSAAVDANEITGLHGAVVRPDGERIAKAYFPGEDERWGSPVGLVDHGPQTLHDLR